mmetsp:Transcript_26720/g.35105  ORF Transcript_26720/g.35105 Transcript_26720/m.35105 type:complete len:398 (+) Transcript_26720:41-1234(+)
MVILKTNLVDYIGALLLISFVLNFKNGEGYLNHVLSSSFSSTRSSKIFSSQGDTTLDELQAKKDALKSCLRREYTSFFQPFEKEFYEPNVQFIDPLNTLEGIDKYQNNVDLLGGRTPLGKLLFSDAGINLHSVEETGPNTMQTRWTLKVCFQVLPWKPVAKFTGVSKYVLNDDMKVVQQTDYWDSINLIKGEYQKVDFVTGLKDFVGQLFAEQTATNAMGAELPYELLRRGPNYEVRRYPSYQACVTTYETRPEGYDRLGSYTGGENENRERLQPLTPSLLSITRDGKKKSMEWPLQFLMPFEKDFGGKVPPKAGSERISFKEAESKVYAVLVFDSPTTQEFVTYWNSELEKAIKKDNLVAEKGSENLYYLAQYDAIFSLQKRRNEVWVPLEVHDWN